MMKEEVIDNEKIDRTSQGEELIPELDGFLDETDNVADENFDEGDKSAELAAESALWQDKYARLAAEFDNYRKRTLKEKMDLVATGGEDVILSLLGVVDDMDRALEAMKGTQEVKAVQEGVLLIYQKMMNVLHAKGLQEIESLGKELDTDLHEAIAQVPAAEQSLKGKIVEVVQKGYKLKDKVARFAKVVVGV